MYQLTTHASFDSAHFLSGYEGKCSNIHGHRWKLEVTVQSETLEQTGRKKSLNDSDFVKKQLYTSVLYLVKSNQKKSLNL